MRFRRRDLALAALAAALPAGHAPPAAAADFTGHVQSTVAAWRSDSRGDEAGWLNGFRVAGEQDLGPLRLDAAYEFAIVQAEPEAGGGTDWLNLQGTLSRGRRLDRRHRFDRLQLAWSPADDIDLTIGRQAVSWGTTIYLTPADPFAPFSPSDTFREYRRGVDALRLRAWPDALSEVDLVLRPSRLQEREELTVLGRTLTTWKNWEVSSWGGSLYGDAAAAIGAAGEIGDWAIRFETVLRDTKGRTRGRGALGAYRTLQVGDRDLDLALEYQRDGLGAVTEKEFEDLLQSDPYRRGEMQVPGRDQVLARAAYRIHPLWEIAWLTLWNPNSGSAVLAPGFTYSVSDEATLTGGAFAHIADPVPESALPEETRDRAASAGALLSLTWYF